MTSRLPIIECLIQDSITVIDTGCLAGSNCKTIAGISCGLTVFAPSQALSMPIGCDHSPLIVNAVPKHRISSGAGTDRNPKHTLAEPLVQESMARADIHPPNQRSKDSFYVGTGDAQTSTTGGESQSERSPEARAKGFHLANPCGGTDLVREPRQA